VEGENKKGDHSPLPKFFLGTVELLGFQRAPPPPFPFPPLTPHLHFTHPKSVLDRGCCIWFFFPGVMVGPRGLLLILPFARPPTHPGGHASVFLFFLSPSILFHRFVHVWEGFPVLYVVVAPLDVPLLGKCFPPGAPSECCYPRSLKTRDLKPRFAKGRNRVVKQQPQRGQGRECQVLYPQKTGLVKVWGTIL